MFISCCGVVVPYYYPVLTPIITPKVEIIFDKLLVFLNLLLECRANRHNGLGRMVRDLQQMDRESYKGLSAFCHPNTRRAQQQHLNRWDIYNNAGRTYLNTYNTGQVN